MVMNVNRPEGLGGGATRGSAGIEGAGGKNVSKINKNGSAAPVDAATKKRHAANEKSLNDAISKLLNGPWYKD